MRPERCLSSAPASSSAASGYGHRGGPYRVRRRRRCTPAGSTPAAPSLPNPTILPVTPREANECSPPRRCKKVSASPNASSTSGLALIFYRCPRIDLIAFQHDFPGLFFDANADDLLARVSRTGITDNVVAKDEVFGFAAHANARG